MQEADRVVVMIPKSKVKYQKLLNSLEEMGLEDFGCYSSIKEAKEDFNNFDKPKGRTAIIESDEGVIELK